MNKTLIIGALTFLGLSSCATSSSSPAMADLRALDKEGSKKELVERLGLVAPAERDGEWFAIAERGAAAYLGQLNLEESSGEGALKESESLLERFPQLGRSTTFMSARLELGVKAFRANHGSFRHSGGSNPWVAKMVAFIEKDTLTPDGPSRLAKDVVLGRLIPVAAYPLFEVAAKRDAAKACADQVFTQGFVDAAIAGSWVEENAKLVAGACASKKGDLKTAFKAEGRTRDEQRALCKLIGEEADMKEACAKANERGY